MIKVALTLSAEQQKMLARHEQDYKRSINRVILSKRGEVYAEQHLIDIGFSEPTLEHFMWTKWIESIENDNI